MALIGPGERYEGAVVEFGRGCEASVVVGQSGLGDEAVDGLDCCAAGQRRFLDQAILESCALSGA